MATRAERVSALQVEANSTVDGRPEAYVPPERRYQNRLQELATYARKDLAEDTAERAKIHEAIGPTPELGALPHILTPRQRAGDEQIIQGVDRRFTGMNKLNKRQRWITGSVIALACFVPAGYSAHKIVENVGEIVSAVQEIGDSVGDVFDLDTWKKEKALGGLVEYPSPGETAEQTRTRVYAAVDRIDVAYESTIFHAKWGGAALTAGVIGETLFAGMAWHPRNTGRSIRGRWDVRRGMWRYGSRRPWQKGRYRRMVLDNMEAREGQSTTP